MLHPLKFPRRFFKCAALLLPLLWTTGCFDINDDLTLKADGSGKVRIEARLISAVAAIHEHGMDGMMGNPEQTILYPPTTEDEARRLFPAKDFTVNVKVDPAGGQSMLVVDAAFTNVNALLSSPYGRVHALTLSVEKGALLFKGLTGLEAAARLAEMKEDGGKLGMPDLSEARKHKDKMRARFRLTTPAPAAGANGTRDGKTVAWSFERSKAKDGSEFIQQLSVPLEARCSAEGFKPQPVTPPRLALADFSALQEGVFRIQGSAPDPAKIAAAVKFVPYALQVVRTFDLSGESGSRQNEARLIGALLVPNEYAPQKWGELKIEEVTDAKGNRLKSQNRGGSSNRYFDDQAEAASEDGPEARQPAHNEKRRMLTLAFQPPDWGIKEIARIKASMELQYFGGANLVKLTNAIQTNWVREIKTGRDADSDSSAKKLSSPKLLELGFILSVQQCVTLGEITVLNLYSETKKGDITDAQVFDRSGKPWPTLVVSESGSESVQMTIVGRPQPPLSLALLISGGGAVVGAPILLEHLPVTGENGK